VAAAIRRSSRLVRPDDRGPTSSENGHAATRRRAARLKRECRSAQCWNIVGRQRRGERAIKFSSAEQRFEVGTATEAIRFLFALIFA